MKKMPYILLALIGSISLSVQAASINPAQVAAISSLVTKYAMEAQKEDPKATFSAAEGKQFYRWWRRDGDSEVSCYSCHTINPANEGRNTVTDRPIKPLAPSRNPDRFTSLEKIESNMTKHCFDLYKKDCTAKQKTDFFMYLLSVK